MAWGIDSGIAGKVDKVWDEFRRLEEEKGRKEEEEEDGGGEGKEDEDEDEEQLTATLEECLLSDLKKKASSARARQ